MFVCVCMRVGVHMCVRVFLCVHACEIKNVIRAADCLKTGSRGEMDHIQS